MEILIAILIVMAAICFVASIWIGFYTMILKIIFWPLKLLWKLITLPFRNLLH